MEKRIIVVSAINMIDGGALTILKNCVAALSADEFVSRYRIIVLVHKRILLPQYEGIEYIEFPKSKSHYYYRLYYEYISFSSLSKCWKPLLWLSLHDTSPKVRSDIHAVYMHNPTPFYKPKLNDWRFVPINALWAYLYKYVYRINIHSNDYLIVQQQWLRDSFSKMFIFPKDKIIVARPVQDSQVERSESITTNKECFTFLFPTYPRVFKNVDVLCEAALLLEKSNHSNLKFVLTMAGSENRYSKYIYEKYKDAKLIEFRGLVKLEDMGDLYEQSDCLIFPSKLETWGLPISEYKPYNRPMIIADLPYAHETAAGANKVVFFDPNSANDLVEKILKLINGEEEIFQSIPQLNISEPKTSSWKELFYKLLGE